MCEAREKSRDAASGARLALGARPAEGRLGARSRLSSSEIDVSQVPDVPAKVTSFRLTHHNFLGRNTGAFQAANDEMSDEYESQVRARHHRH